MTASTFPTVAKCSSIGSERHSVVADLDGTLLRGQSSFPYFSLVAFEVLLLQHFSIISVSLSLPENSRRCTSSDADGLLCLLGTCVRVIVKGNPTPSVKKSAGKSGFSSFAYIEPYLIQFSSPPPSAALSQPSLTQFSASLKSFHPSKQLGSAVTGRHRCSHDKETLGRR
ncbi:hypothetical protein L6164_008490 [Bauhinia variegata]|uniref:Uncharacterized protein n=1 Tax=Bauhinia variegata TaxID=167791 RepID=A0ACB9PGY5_BAUVA|nr:hypothetical protein L6164_008490 [Bauhinia variegata]